MQSEQIPLDDVLSKMSESQYIVLSLPACVLRDHRISVYTHIGHADRRLVTATPHYTTNAHIDMSNTEKSNTHRHHNDMLTEM